MAHIEHLLITGASGFVGRSVIDYLSKLLPNQRPEMITLVARGQINDLGNEIGLNLKIKQLQADLLDEWKFDRSVTHILQLAADGSENAYSQKASNDFVTFTQRLIEWCETLASKPVVVHASSGACFGYFPLIDDDENERGLMTAGNARWSKASFVEGRLKAEKLLQRAYEFDRFELRVARLFSFIGEHIRKKTQYAAPSFISMAKTSRIIRITGNPLTVRSYLSAFDMSNWIVAALKSDVKLPLLSIGSSIPVTMIELAEFVAVQLSAKVAVEGHHRDGDFYVADNKLTKDLLEVSETISWREALLDLMRVI